MTILFCCHIISYCFFWFSLYFSLSSRLSYLVHHFPFYSTRSYFLFSVVCSLYYHNLVCVFYLVFHHFSFCCFSFVSQKQHYFTEFIFTISVPFPIFLVVRGWTFSPSFIYVPVSYLSVFPFTSSCYIFFSVFIFYFYFSFFALSIS